MQPNALDPSDSDPFGEKIDCFKKSQSFVNTVDWWCDNGIMCGMWWFKVNPFPFTARRLFLI